MTSVASASTITSTATTGTALIVTSLEMSPEQISCRLGTNPTRSALAGEPVSRSAGAGRTRRTHLWVRSLAEAPGDVAAEQLARLCEMLENRDIEQLDLRAQVALSAEHDMALFSVGEQVVRRLSRLSLPVTFDLYPPAGSDQLPQHWKTVQASWVTRGIAEATTPHEQMWLPRRAFENRIDSGLSPQATVAEHLEALLSSGPPPGKQTRLALAVGFSAVNGQGSVALTRAVLDRMAGWHSALELQLRTP